jgi:hypothetical protein
MKTKPPNQLQHANNVLLILNKLLKMPVNVFQAISHPGLQMLQLSARPNVTLLELKQQLVIIVPVILILSGNNVKSHVLGQTLKEEMLRKEMLIPKNHANVKMITFLLVQPVLHVSRVHQLITQPVIVKLINSKNFQTLPPA